MYTHTYTYVHLRTLTYSYVHLRTLTYTCVHLRTLAYTYVHLRTYVRTYIPTCIHACMRAWLHIYMYNLYTLGIHLRGHIVPDPTPGLSRFTHGCHGSFRCHGVAAVARGQNNEFKRPFHQEKWGSSMIFAIWHWIWWKLFFVTEPVFVLKPGILTIQFIQFKHVRLSRAAMISRGDS